MSSGIFSGSVVALITPFTSENTIDFDCVTRLIEWHIASGTSAIVIAGTTGESPTLSSDEVYKLAKHAVEVNAKRIGIIVGNGSNNTQVSCDMTKRLNSLDIDGYLTVTPYYNKPTDEGLVAHFTAIAQSTELPIILYNVPGRTMCDMSNHVVAKLSELSNVVGIKDATADLARVTQLRDLCGPSFLLLSGDDETGCEYCCLGGDGVISVSANLIPKQMAEIQSLIKTNQSSAAKSLDQQFAALHKDLFVESNPIAVKWAMHYLKIIPNALLRLPLTMISSQGKCVIEDTLNKLNPDPQEN